MFSSVFAATKQGGRTAFNGPDHDHSVAVERLNAIRAAPRSADADPGGRGGDTTRTSHAD